MSEYWVLEFKGARYDKFFNPERVPIRPSEFAVVQAEKGEDMGRLLRVIYSDREYEKEEEVFNILRRAAPEDLNRYKEVREKEKTALRECRTLVEGRGLLMRLVDAEMQFDGSKIIFFFSAEKRVDFRDLVRELASIHKTRIEMRQIGAREEARRLGGVRTVRPQAVLYDVHQGFSADFHPVCPGPGTGLEPAENHRELRAAFVLFALRAGGLCPGDGPVSESRQPLCHGAGGGGSGEAELCEGVYGRAAYGRI